MSVIERRACPRFVVAGATLTWRDEADAGRGGSQCAVGDLSRGGARFVTPGPAPAGTPVELRLDLPDASDVLVLRGRIVWTRLTSGQFHDVGVEFAPYGDAAASNPASALERLARLETAAIAAGRLG